MVVIYRLLQTVLRRLIDWLMTVWLWANKNEKATKGREEHGRQ